MLDSYGAEIINVDDLPVMAGVNTANGIRQVNNNLALYLRLLRKFRESYCYGFEGDYDDAMRAGDMELAQRLVHSLKGCALSLGVDLIGELAGQLDMAIRNQCVADISEGHGKLTSELKKLGAELAVLG